MADYPEHPGAHHFYIQSGLWQVQIEAGNYADAVKTFEEDLIVLPRNGWAQHGLKLAYEKMEANLKESWATADVEIEISRIK